MLPSNARTARMSNVAQGDAVAVEEGQQGLGRLGKPTNDTLAYGALGHFRSRFRARCPAHPGWENRGIHRGKPTSSSIRSKRGGLHVFHLLRDVVNLVPAKAHLLDQEHLGQTCFHHQRRSFSLAVSFRGLYFVFKEAILLKALAMLFTEGFPARWRSGQNAHFPASLASANNAFK